MPRAYIRGLGKFHPEQVITNQDLVDRFGIDTTNEWIIQRTGIEERRFIEAGEATSDLGAKAGLAAIEDAGLGVDDIDMILFCTLSPDHPFPGAGPYAQHKMGMKAVPVMDIRNQCSGFIYGLGTASSMIAAGQYKNILVVGAEIHSTALDLTTRGRTVACLFGDGAGAAVVSATEEDRGIRWWHVGADGEHADALAQKTWDVARKPHYIRVNEAGEGVVPSEDMWPQMNGRKVFKHATEKMIGSLMALCWENDLELNDLDMVFFHQANLRINQFIADQLKLPAEKCPSNIQKFGNTTAATIPTLMAECKADGRLKPGMKVGAVAFGSGFTWGAALIDY